jgi:Holliday junction resolvase RusA-like endonuclease
MNYALNLELNLYKTDANKTKGHNRYSVHTLFKKVKDDIQKLTLGKRPDRPLTSFQITVTRQSSKFLDYDNLISSLKPIIDGLKLSGVIKDDSWEYIKHIEVDQVKSKEKKFIINVKEVA